MSEIIEADSGCVDQTHKQMSKAKLSKGMEHIRSIVTVAEDRSTANQDSQQDVGENAYGVPAAHLPLRKPTSDSAATPFKRTDPFQFGSRYLEEGDDIFSHNAWDHVETDDAYKSFIEEQAALQRASPVAKSDKVRFTQNPEKWWDKFYGNNKANFFKDRKWLVQEFPVLSEVTREDYGPATVLEIGAGAGNTAFPILQINKNPQLRVHACDYSKKAVHVMRGSPLYDTKIMQADVWDAAGQGDASLPPGIDAGSVDVAIMIFIFSALSPTQWTQALWNVWSLLKPGGTVLFRDYGRGDLAQVRFKKGRYLEENFYIRGDGTRVYFFERDELEQIWSGRSSKSIQEPQNEIQVDGVTETLEKTDLEGVVVDRPKFDVVNLAVDRRMLVNRQRKLKMYRCWMQGLFRKPSSPAINDG